MKAACFIQSRRPPRKRLITCTLHACIAFIPLFILKKTSPHEQWKVDNLHTSTAPPVGIHGVDNERAKCSTLCSTRNTRLYAISRSSCGFFRRRKRLGAILLIWALCWRSDTWNGYWETVDAAAEGPSSALLYIYVYINHNIWFLERARVILHVDNTHKRNLHLSERESGYYSLPPHMCAWAPGWIWWYGRGWWIYIHVQLMLL